MNAREKTEEEEEDDSRLYKSNSLQVYKTSMKGLINCF